MKAYSLILFYLLGLVGQGAGASNQGQPGTPTFFLRETELEIKQVDVAPVMQRDELGYPRLDWTRFDQKNPPVTTRRHRAVILENQYLRVVLLPEMGRVYSLFSKLTGTEQLWLNPVAKPIPAHNDLGWWMVWGGIEYTLPRGEHGTTWALPWEYRITENSPARKAVAMTVLEPQTKLKQTLEVSLSPARAFFAATITITNIGTEPALFAHWINPMWAPGGRNEVTARTEMIVPCETMLVADRNFNRWMLGARRQEYERNPLRFVEHWRSIGDLLCQRLTAGFFSAFAHELNEGVVRVFDPTVTPGMDIWTWGYPPPLARQQEYSGVVPNLGYVEMWGGTARDFSDEARRSLSPGASLSWTEWMYPYSQLKGLTYANQEVAVNLQYDSANQSLWLGLYPTQALQAVQVSLHAAGKTFWQRALALSPARPYVTTVPVPATVARRLPQPPVVQLRVGPKLLAEVPAKVVAPLQWGGEYLPAPEPK